MVDGDQRRRFAQRPDGCSQSRKLRGRVVVAREQDHATDQRMRDPFAVLRIEHEPRYVQHHRAASLREWQRNPVRTRQNAHPAAASRISAFICRTASRRPTNTDRLTMA